MIFNIVQFKDQLQDIYLVALFYKVIIKELKNI